MDRGSDKNIANQSSYTPNRSATLNSRIVLSLPNDSDTVSDKYMANQLSFIPKGTSTSTSRINPNQTDDPNTVFGRDKEN